MPASPSVEVEDLQSRCIEATERVGEIVLGKPEAIRLALACMLARGHLLIEDIPGVGKTTLSHALARVLRLDYRRVQFTSDLLPADVIGTTVFERDSGLFRFQRGAIFAELVLADEINRSPPKTQSALLEAMEEGQVTVEGHTHPLPQPFFVIATQNPREQAGTYPLPQSQLDRFLMCIAIGYPSAQAEQELLAGEDRRASIATLAPVLDPHELLALQATIPRIHASPALLHYILAILAASRSDPRFPQGLSPRAGLSLLTAARAWAFLEGRNHVLPEDVQAMLAPVVNHRLGAVVDSREGTIDAATHLRTTVAIP